MKKKVLIGVSSIVLIVIGLFFYFIFKDNDSLNSKIVKNINKMNKLSIVI